MEIQEPLFKLILRFSNGETISYIVREPIDATKLASESKYALITSYSTQDSNQCTDVTLINLRDLTFLRTERVTLDQLASERRMAGIRSTGSPHDDKAPRAISEIKFI
jgi:hypothetical protein